MINWLRKHHFLHDWEEWNVTRTGNVTLNDRKLGYFYSRNRVCKVCCKVEIEAGVKYENI